MKKCTTCKVEKPKSEFYKDANKSDGLYSRCKLCHTATVKQYHQKHHDAHAEAQRRWYGNNRESALLMYKNIRENNPQKTRARDAVNNAIKHGRIVRLPCAECGNEKTHAHHDDYNKPLQVIWLCPKHHKKLHHGIA